MAAAHSPVYSVAVKMRRFEERSMLFGIVPVAEKGAEKRRYHGWIAGKISSVINNCLKGGQNHSLVRITPYI